MEESTVCLLKYYVTFIAALRYRLSNRNTCWVYRFSTSPCCVSWSSMVCSHPDLGIHVDRHRIQLSYLRKFAFILHTWLTLEIAREIPIFKFETICWQVGVLFSRLRLDGHGIIRQDDPNWTLTVFHSGLSAAGFSSRWLCSGISDAHWNRSACINSVPWMFVGSWSMTRQLQASHDAAKSFTYSWLSGFVQRFAAHQARLHAGR